LVLTCVTSGPRQRQRDRLAERKRRAPLARREVVDVHVCFLVVVMRMMMRIVVAISASYLQYCGLISEGIGYNNVLRDAFELQARDRLETVKDRSNKDVDAEIESVVMQQAQAVTCEHVPTRDKKCGTQAGTRRRCARIILSSAQILGAFKFIQPKTLLRKTRVSLPIRYSKIRLVSLSNHNLVSIDRCHLTLYTREMFCVCK
jgi:hypothetical protein